MLPPPANLAGNQHHCVLALVHHASDPFTNTKTNTDAMTSGDRKAAHKNLTVVQFTGALPSSPPIVLPFRIHNARENQSLLTDLVLNLSRYPGRVRVLIPELKIDGVPQKEAVGFAVKKIGSDVLRWAQDHIKAVQSYQRRKERYNDTWSKRRISDVQRVLQGGKLLEATDNKQTAIRRISLPAGDGQTLFLVFDRPLRAKIGQAFDFELLQVDTESKQVIGGLGGRVELAPASKIARARGRVRAR